MDHSEQGSGGMRRQKKEGAHAEATGRHVALGKFSWFDEK
jgi:hypothetical protein